MGGRQASTALVLYSPIYPVLNSAPPVGKVRSRAGKEGRVRLRAMVAKGMHIGVRGP